MRRVAPHPASLLEPSLPYVNAKIHVLDSDFLLLYLEPCGCFVEPPEETDLLLAMNSIEPTATQRLAEGGRAEQWCSPSTPMPIAWRT
jgi:hypothetical protein